MPGLNSRLRTLEAKGQPIRVAMTGAGWMGSGFVAAISIMPGMEVAVIVDDDVDAARMAFVAAGYATESVVVAQSVGQATDALRSGKRLVTGAQDLASQLEAVDVVVDVTPSPAIGARTAFSAIRHGKDVVMVNIEADVTVGRVLRHLAEKSGVMYTVSSGDEPGCIKELYDFVDALGYEVIAVGKGKILEGGDVRPLDLKKGDRVLFGKYSGTEVKVDGEDFLVMREDDVMAVIEG